jgi:hypothetical protein
MNMPWFNLRGPTLDFDQLQRRDQLTPPAAVDATPLCEQRLVVLDAVDPDRVRIVAISPTEDGFWMITDGGGLQQYVVDYGLCPKPSIVEGQRFLILQAVGDRLLLAHTGVSAQPPASRRGIAEIRPGQSCGHRAHAFLAITARAGFDTRQRLQPLGRQA